MEKIKAGDYLQIAKIIGGRSECLRRKVGAIAVKRGTIISSGVNGSVTGTPSCVSCLREELNIPSGADTNTCRAVHAEQRLLVRAGLNRVSIEDSTIFITHKPCFTCLKLLAEAKVKAIVYKEDYPDKLTDTFLQENGWRTDVIRRQDGYTTLMSPKTYSDLWKDFLGAA